MIKFGRYYEAIRMVVLAIPLEIVGGKAFDAVAKDKSDK